MAAGRVARNPRADLYSPEMEQALVACALMDGGVYDLAGVQPQHFHRELHAKVWQAIGAVRRADEYVDFTTVLHQLDVSNSGVAPGELAHIAAAEANVTHFETYAHAVLAYAHRRAIVALAERAASIAYKANGSYADDLAHLRDAFGRAVDQISEQKPDRARPATGWSAADLLAADFPEPTWAVPDFVPVGLTALGGRPKVGKSWLALQIAIAKGTGGMTLNQRVTPGRVLYLALEDNGRRLRDRAIKQGMPASATIRFETSWPRLTQGGLGLLAQAIDAEGYTFVVLDTLGRAVGRLDRNDYGDNTELMGALQELAISRDIAVLAVDHTRKPVAGLPSDPVDDIIGSTGKTGAVDAVLSLTKSQGKRGAVLSITGREVIQESYALSWDGMTFCWQLDGTAEEVEIQGRRGLVLSVLEESEDSLTAGEIATRSGLQRQNVLSLLNSLVREGDVTREPKRGKEQPYRSVKGKTEV